MIRVNFASRMQCSTRLSHVPTPLNYRLSALVSRDEFPEERPPANTQLTGFRTTGLPLIMRTSIHCLSGNEIAFYLP